MESQQVLVNAPATAPAVVSERTEILALRADLDGGRIGDDHSSLPTSFGRNEEPAQNSS